MILDLILLNVLRPLFCVLTLGFYDIGMSILQILCTDDQKELKHQRILILHLKKAMPKNIPLV